MGCRFGEADEPPCDVLSLTKPGEDFKQASEQLVLSRERQATSVLLGKWLVGLPLSAVQNNFCVSHSKKGDPLSSNSVTLHYPGFS